MFAASPVQSTTHEVNVLGVAVVSLPRGMRSGATASRASERQAGGGSEHDVSARTLSVKIRRTFSGRERSLATDGSGAGVRSARP
jgi:hypothetical protein